MEGDFRGPSSRDCEKSYARTGVLSAAQIENGNHFSLKSKGLVQITGVQLQHVS
jgi:hypothetical protein